MLLLGRGTDQSASRTVCASMSTVGHLCRSLERRSTTLVGVGKKWVDGGWGGGGVSVQ